jgi:protocadherin Fat 4
MLQGKGCRSRRSRLLYIAHTTGGQLSISADVVTINQNRRAGHLLATLNCSEPAASYHILAVSPNVSFLQLDSTLGELQLAVDALDLVTASYSVSLGCSYPSGSNDAILTVRRVDENEFPPFFAGGSGPTSISETVDVTTVVRRVHATDADFGSFGVIAYSITTPGISSTFGIDESTGDISLLMPLDFEQRSSYQFDVVATNIPTSAGEVRMNSILVILNVIDVDDTSPVFSNSSYSLSLAENNPMQLDVLSLACTDMDTVTSRIRYGFGDGGHGPFQLDQVTGDITVPALGLDYETTTLYSFTVTCYDNSMRNNSGSALVDVSVLPVNEYTPTPLIRFGFASVNEVTPVGTILFMRLDTTTQDRDTGPDGNVTYTLGSNADEALVQEFLSINITTGELVIARQLDFDVDNPLSRSQVTPTRVVRADVRITVCDEFPPPFRRGCPNVQINLFLTALNEFLPEFSEEEYSMTVSESADFNALVLRVNCTDRDLIYGHFNQIDFSAASEAVLDSFVIDHMTGEIRVRDTLDYERTTNYGFDVRCNDTLGLEDTALVTIQITPVNDNLPTFDQTTYQFNVSRTTPANRYPVGRVSAADLDNDFGGDLFYSETQNDFFRIDSDGVVQLINSVQNASGSGLRFDAIVHDGPNDTFNEASALVVITFTEGNMRRPVFTVRSRAVEISELLPMGDIVTTVQCVDNETGLNGVIRYSLESRSAANLFTVDEINGDITVAAVLTLPRSVEVEQYFLDITCEDRGVPRLSNLITILVRVIQDDSSPPVINDSTIFRFVSEDTPINAPIVQINATDLDTDFLLYSLEDESQPGAFIIDPPSGIVTLAAPLDRETVSLYTMTVVVTERRAISGPERSDNATLTILVRDVNDNAPSCDQTSLVVTVPDTQLQGDRVLALNCTDLDVGINGNLEYSLEGAFGVLAVDSAGVLYLNNSLELEDRNNFGFEVVVSDQGLPQLRNSYHITVRISSTNRNIPRLLNLPTSISVPESQLLQSIVFAIEAEDPDRGSFGQLTYQIVGDSENDNFDVIPNTGNVLLVSRLSFFDQQVHILNISVEDADFIVYGVLKINVTDVNEFSPICEESFITSTIAEGLPANQILAESLRCSDRDQGPNGVLTFAIVSGDDTNAFRLNGDGTLTVLETLDFEQVQCYSLLVVVSDGGTPPRMANSSWNVVVQAVNEFAPDFNNRFYREFIPENSTVGRSVLTVTAMDLDLSTHQDGRVEYSISGLDSSLFTISRSSGLLQVAGDLDRETQETFSFTVTASDQGIPPMMATSPINVTLTDVDDNSPVFTEQFYHATHNQTDADSVLTVECTDPDAGSNAAVTYSLDPRSDDAQYFQVSDSGVISVNGVLAISKTYTFGVVCSGPPPASGFDTAVVIIQAVVDTIIMFLPSNTYTQVLNEDINPVYDVLTISALSSTNASLTYSLLTEGSTFRLDGSTGILRLVNTLDFETDQSYALRVQATDSGSPPNVAEALVDIQIQNVNDESPVITTVPPVLNRTEGPSPETEVLLDFECSDEDEGSFGDVSFRIETGNELGVFSISSSGTLLLVGDIDYEIAQSFTLDIVCEDGGSPRQSDSVSLSVDVIPVNDHPPMFSEISYTIGVAESVLVNSPIGNIVAVDGDLPPHSGIHYSLIPDTSTFGIAPTTGELTLLRLLDFEGVRMYTFSVLVEDSGGNPSPGFPVLNDTTMVTINVLDVNDNSPLLPRGAFTGSIVEEAGVGAEVVLVDGITCSDADSGDNGNVSLSVSSSVFQIHPNSGIVTAAENLNFELQSSYSLSVFCTDRGTPVRSSMASLFITVTDVNEFSPRFMNESGYIFSVLESALVGDEVGIIEAIDEDAGEAGIVSYSFFLNGTAPPFSLDSATGVITLSSGLDFETQRRQYILQALARDNAGNSNEATVIINVENVDDHVPEFSANVYFLSISENASRDSSAGRVECTDADNIALGVPVRYTMLSNSPFAVNNETGVITTVGTLDLEAIPRFSLRITCTDAADNEAFANVTLSLLPFNDFTPTFIQLHFNTSVVEDIPTGTSVLQLRASDDDIVDYFTVTYTITSGNDGGLFSLDPDSGILRIRQNIDRETVSTHMLEVQAENVVPPTDTSGSTSLYSVASVYLEVLDVNDNSPTISPSDPPPVFILESDGPSAFVLQLTCSDLDAGPNGTTSFSIPNLDSRERFRISENEELTTRTLIRTNEVVSVTCSDGGIPPRSDSVDVSVTTMSINDHPPMFGSARYHLRVREDTPIGEEVACINATDRDGPDTPDGVVEHSLRFTGSGVSKFSIVESTGCIFVSIALDFDVTMLFEYTLFATDLGVMALQGNATLVIEITDEVRDPPRFQEDSYVREIPESATAGSFIAAIACTDPDINDTTTYGFVDGAAEFDVNPMTGRIETVTVLDFEITQSYILGVFCNDSFGLTDTAEVSVTVLPINDYSPTFFSTDVDIEENSIIGREVTTLRWIDNDRGLDGEVTFSISAGNTDNVFSITSAGTLLVRGNLDRESVPFYPLNVTITDLSPSEPRSTVGELNVTVLDINDNRPQFAQDVYMFGPLEANETLHYSVGSVSCTDGDTGTNAQTSFRISPENVNFTLFAVDAVTGDIVVSGDLRNREFDTITFMVLCVDSGFPPLATSARVLVRVDETNAHSPEFLNSSYYIEVLEDTEILQDVILTVHAVDQDIGINGVVRYHLLDTFSGQFFLDERTGELSLLTPLDFERESSYSLIAVARDGAVDRDLRLRSTVPITVQVLGVNEHIPSCRNAIYVAVVNATSQGGIVELSCTDDDEGRDGQLQYSITRGNEGGFFDVENGSIVIPVPFSPRDGTERFMLQVLVEDLGDPSRSVTVDAIIIVSFDNLAAPEFVLSLYSIHVSELTEVGTVVATLRATDADPSIQGQVTYSVAGSDHFRIDADSGDLFVASPLDWETSPFLSFTVIAEDGDPLNPLRDVATVNVSVLNENDNPPLCDRNLYTAQIPSNASAGTTVVTLNCTDLDQDMLRYTSSAGNAAFSVNPTTGEVSVAGPLVDPTYLVNIEVTDSGGERIVVFVNIATLFANLEPPRFVSPSYTFSVSEQAPLLSVVGAVLASDADSDDSSLVYSLTDAGLGGFYVNPSTGDIILTVPLDFEITQLYTLIVQVADLGGYDGSNRLRSNAVVTVDVTNTNDNLPVFSDGGIYGRTIPETTPISSSILTISCTDDDLAPYGLPSVSSSAFDNTPFSLQDVGGGRVEVIVSERLVGPNSYFLNVTCSDGTEQAVEGQVFLFVPEPLAPTFSQPVYEWFVSELSVTGTAYTAVQATSNDDSEITFNIADGNNDNIFHIDPSNGVVSLVLSLDYETQRRHGLIVRAVDAELRESNVLLLVQVLDANDEVPLIPPSALLNITQNQLPGYPVGSVECVDADANINSTIFNYTFSPPSRQFSIDEFGVIRLEAELDSTPAYVIPVVCFDIRDPTVNTTGIITIEVEFVNLQEPEFVSPLYQFRIPEDLEVLSPIGDPLTATDSDIGSFSELVYLIDEQEQFFIESETGRMGLLTSLDREVQDVYTVTVIAVDGGPSAIDTSRRTGTTTVMVTVEDTNDNAPIPSQLSYVQVISTNHTVLSPVISTTCSDPDVGRNGTVTYSISAGSGRENFIIQANGTILLAREQPNQAVYSFFTVCRDEGIPPLSSSALVTITVNFLALSAPIFSEDNYNVTIPENTTVTTPIQRVQATPSDASITVVYSLVGGNERENFFIDSVTGVVSVRNPLDARQEQYYTLVVRAGNAGSDQLFSMATVSVFVEDINDNSPIFQSRFYTSTIPETATLLTPVVSVSCVDSDINSDISYSITEGASDPPTFNITEGGQIAVAGSLDYESVLQYSLQITCSDGGTEPRTAVATVRIAVSPVNEFPPRFSRSEYTFDATENDFGAYIGSIVATDGDIGVHGAVTYLLQDPGNFSVAFVDPSTGDIEVANNLDYEFLTFWNLTVIARDGGGLESSIPLNIQVVNVNDAFPVLEPGAATVRVPVDRMVGFPIQSYACTDADGSSTSVSIANGNGAGYFDLNPINNILYWTGRASGLLSNSIISLTLQCVDTAAPDQTDDSIIAVSVVVMDAVPPVFSEEVYSVSVPEDTPINTTILTVSAVGENAVNYTLSLPSNFPFHISSLEGNISLVRMLNREEEDVHTFFVSASDTITGAIGITQVSITTVDINDNPPVISQPANLLSLPENFSVFVTPIATFSCSDMDTGLNDDVRFVITDGNIGGTFHIDLSGRVYLAQPLDFETITNFTLEITCFDSILSPLSDTAMLLVSVTGFNEHPPVFENSTYFFSVNELALVGDVIGVVSATDGDAGLDGHVTYAILTGSDNFIVRVPSGELLLSTGLDFETQPRYDLVIEARDGAEGPLQMTSTVDVVIEVTQANEHTPICRSAIYVGIVNDTTQGNIVDFFCSDADEGRDGQLSYTILTGNEDEYFVAADDRLIVPVPFRPVDGSEEFVLNIVVEDLGTPSRRTFIEVLVTYSFENLAAPEFLQSLYALNVSELTEVGTVVATLRATDADPSIQGQVTYSVAGSDHFRIDADSGDLFVASPLDWETSPFLSFTVIAEDGDPLNPLRDVATVNVSVLNENDNPPLCDRNLYTAQIPSNASAGTTVITLNCTDLDQNPLRYALLTETSSYSIDSNSGQVSVLGALQDDTTSLLTVSVSGDGDENIIVSVSITLLFINEQPPLFSSSHYVFSVSESADILVTVGSVVAADADLGIGTLTYTSVSPNVEEFYVNPSTGDIVLSVPLDYETVRQYQFTVQVVDAGSYDGSNVLSSTSSITVIVANSNDNRPMFNNGGIYGSTIPETTAPGTSIISISCVDSDDPPFSSPSIAGEDFDGSVPFELTALAPGEAEVRVSGALSGEANYLLNVTCTDGGGEIAEGLVLIFIPEPLAPVFNQPGYEWSISELALIGTSFADVQAASNDNSSVTYSITGGNDAGLFYIDPSSGEVSLILTLDYETQTQHALIVRAADGDKRQSSVVLLVQVLDANDEVPLIPPSALLNITQNQLPGYPVGSVECVDADANINSTIFNYTFSPPSRQFSIDEFGVIRLEAELDSTPAYVIPVVCFDIRDPTVNTTGIITIEVEFVNLQEPEFVSPLYQFRIPEDLEVLSPIGDPLTATDSDIGSFSELVYLIDEQEQFFIESETGRMGLLTSLDREVQDVYTVTVIAVDGGPSAIDTSRRTGTTTVMVTVEDTNDNAPIPSQLSYVQVISTNHTVLSPVISTTCSDPDVGRNGTVTYSISAGSGRENFIIQANGTILLAREQPNQAVYSFFTVCRDEGIPPLSSSALVTITVNFLALSAPIFSEDNYNVTIPENTTVTTPIQRVQATPSDASITVVYSLVGGNERENFFIDSVTGVVSVRNPLDARQEQYYTLVVRAGNAGSDQLFSMATVSVFVEDINDNSPSFESQFYSGTVSEGSVLMTPVISVVCEDSDVNSEISYSITGGLSYPPEFNITQGGQILVAGVIDYESTVGYSLQVTCNDGGHNPRTVMATVRVTVAPVNEFAPMFISPSGYTFSATENNFQALIGSIEAVDGDAGSHGSVTYLLQDPGNFSVVLVNPTTGAVRVSNNLDYEFRPFWNLTVIARDGGGLEMSTPLNIEVLNINDVDPVLEPRSALRNITFDEEPNTALQPYLCSDGDGSATTLSIVNGNVEGYFELSGNVVVWTGRAANLTVNFVTAFTVRCHDDAAPDQFDDGIIAVSIVVTDAVPPVFSELSYSASVPEDIPLNATVLTVSAVGENEVGYSLPSLPSGFPFSINAVDGRVFLVQTLNREAEDAYSFFISATDLTTGAIATSRVDITLVDVNDNAPVINPRSQPVAIPEDHVLSSSFVQFACTDSDTGGNGQVDFEITDGDALGVFTIDTNGLVSLVQPLDFESVTNYTLEVTCRDGAETPQSDIAMLLVMVDGVNEYSPVFTNSTYTFSVSEYARVGDLVGEVSATDLDAGLDGEVRYSVLSGSGMDFFTLRQSGSVVTSVLPLNATTHPTLELSVRAMDGGRMDSDTLIVVTVEDVNEPPQFSGAGSYFVMESTDLSPGDTVLQFTCYDTDIPSSDKSALDLVISDPGIGLDLYLQTAERSGAVDADLISNSTISAGSYTLSVTCSDRGIPPISSTTSVTLRVDTPNTPPQFTGSILQNYVVAEDTLAGTQLFVVNATDSETAVTYSITGGTGLGSFQIDGTSGSVRTFLSLDYETTPVYSLEITASDLSTFDRRSATVSTTIIVTNVNDNDPRLMPEALALTVSEDSDPTSTPILVEYSCSDPDGSEPVVTIATMDDLLPFAISQSGGITLEAFLDYEVLTNHSIVVTCTDQEIRSGEGSTRSVTTSLIINVIPVNIHSPVFTPPQSTFEVSESALIGDSVGVVRAMDGDGRGDLGFSSSSHRGVFHVGADGNITLVSRLDFETTVEYILSVLASDNDNAPNVEPKTTSSEVVIRVSDENDNPPLCDMNVLPAAFETGTYDNPPFTLAQLNCSDRDSGLNGVLQYSITDDSLPSLPQGSFLLNASTGELVFQGTIEVSGSHVLEVLVEDSGSPVMSTRVTVALQVETANDTRPRFNETVFRVSISESRLSPSIILNGELIRDNFINPLGDRVEFSLQASAENDGAFFIDSATADISLSDSQLIDYETRREYTLTLQATVNSIVEMAVVEISILDFNDNAPRFPMSIYGGSVPENEPPGTPILRVEASDLDSDENRLIRYSIQGGSVSLAIDPDNGTITTLQVLDRESKSRESIVVLATDMGVPPLTGSTTVTINIVDVNDQPPTFVDPVYLVSIADTIQPGDVVVTLQVDDEDEVGNLSFRIENQEVLDVFIIDFNGILRLRTGGLSPDVFRYNFTVVVSDEIASDRATVVIYVLSLTTTTILFEENVKREQFDVGRFLIQNFNISNEAEYSIAFGDPFDEYEIDADGILRVSGALDRENTSRYDLTLNVVDDTTGVNVEVVVTVLVQDQNDNPPVFGSEEYRFNVSEGPYEDDVSFGFVSATDRDQPGTSAATIAYTLIPDTEQFAVTSSGELFLKAGTILDREKVPNYTMIVEARDFGEPTPLHSVVSLLVIVGDINDNDPEFVPLSVEEYLVLLPSDQIPPGTRLDKIIAVLPFAIRQETTTISVTDPDPSSSIFASLEGGSGGKPKFGFTDPQSTELELVTLDDVGKEDFGTVLELVLRDDPFDEDNPVIRNITFAGRDDFFVTTEKLTPVDSPPFFQTAAGIAVIVVICALIVIIALSLCGLICYIRSRAEKDPLQDT